MPDCLIIDTDVLIDYLRGYPAAKAYLESLTQRQIISAMTVAELYTGVHEGAELYALEKLLKAFEVVSINENVAVAGGLFRRKYLKSHGVGIADAIIAATAQLEDAAVVTLDRKHYPMFDNVIVPYQKS